MNFSELFFDDDVDIAQLLSSSDEEEARPGGSRPGKSPNIERGHIEGDARLRADYFCDNPVYGPALFKRRFRVSRATFNRILSSLAAYDPYFVQSRNCTGRIGLSGLQKAKKIGHIC